MEKKGTEFDLGDIARGIVAKSGPEILYAISNEEDLADAIRMILDCVPGVVAEALAEFDEHRVEWPGFGVLQIEARGPRKGRDFHTGKPVDIPQRDKVVFSASPLLAERIEKITGNTTY